MKHLFQTKGNKKFTYTTIYQKNQFIYVNLNEVNDK